MIDWDLPAGMFWKIGSYSSMVQILKPSQDKDVTDTTSSSLTLKLDI